MTADPQGTTVGAADRPALLLQLYAAAIFLSAALLFAVQPMFTKMVLPRFGGAPSVWSVAMVFFQALLLAGYVYAHLLTRYVPGRAAIVTHVAVLIVAALALPLTIAAGWGQPPAVGEALWLIGLFAASIGLPFFALSANGPLLQAWFARTGHPAAGNPYFLYAASNVGSFLALVSYPVAVEPLIRLGDQSRLWSIGFVLLIALIAACGALLWRLPGASMHARVEAAPAAAPTLRHAARWVLLAAVPSGLMVAVTAYLSTDVAAVPLLWVLPLALYLLTFVIVFQTRPAIPHDLVVKLQPLVVVGLVAVFVFELVASIVSMVAVHTIAFFVLALMCHGELAKTRPAPQHLTAFYMWMSLGGMIGGLSAGLIAPYVFSSVLEYPILIMLAVLCRPGLVLPQTRNARLLWIVALTATSVVLLVRGPFEDPLSDSGYKIALGVVLAAALIFWRNPLAMAAVVAFVFIADRVYTEDSGTIAVRSFFGVHKITESDDGRFRVLLHGTTIHGAERKRDTDNRRAGARPDLIMYYYDGSAMAQAINAVRERKGAPISFAVIGLGAGSLACRAEPDDTVTYYEIDPAVIDIASDSRLFTYLSACRPKTPIVLGDARLTLAQAPDGSYDLIMVDAFSSDAIPIHLLTREAMAIYLKKLSPQGMVLLHVSNRHLELASVVAGIADANGLVMRINEGGDIVGDDAEYKFVGTVAVAARRDEDFGALVWSPFWRVMKPDARQWVWTDDYSNIVGSVVRKQQGR
jgi:hypothetical protein